MKVLRFVSCSRLLVAIAAGAMLLSTVGSASAAVLNNADLGTFSETGNMLPGTSHNREAEFAVSGNSITVTDPAGDGLPTNGSANQEMFLSSSFVPFNSAGLRYQLNFDTDFATTWQNFGGSSERFGLAVASAIPVGGPASGNVRPDAGGIFVWGIRSGNALNSYLYTAGGTETNADAGTNLSGANASALGIFMEYTDTGGGSGDQSGWNLGFIDGSGTDQIVQFRNTVNGTAIDADGSVIGLYIDMRDERTVLSIDSLEYGFVPEPTSFVLFGLGALGLACGRRR